MWASSRSCYNNNGTFTVYQETGTPSPTSNNFYFKRGNFFPYNSLNTNNSAQNIYTGDGSLIDYENPNYGSTLYGLSGTTDYYFGMTMDFKLEQYVKAPDSIVFTVSGILMDCKFSHI